MAAAASSLASQFSGLRREVLSRESAPPTALFRSGHSQLRLPTLRRPHRCVVAMAGTGKFFVGGNWKCNGTKDSITKLVADLNDAKLENNVDIVVAPPYIYVDQVKQSLTDHIEISAQNCWVGKGGAFTGEIRSRIPMDTARTGRYIPVCPLIGTWTAYYWAVPSIGVVSTTLPPEIGR
ncbi:hypothetical protein GW17_00005881 [Ensete ventricosum]|nr:hypothetical protein GW17_00005881 [Ensete ventricosum]